MLLVCYLFNYLIIFIMLQIFKAKVNGKDGYVCVMIKDGQRTTQQFAFNNIQDIAAVIDLL